MKKLFALVALMGLGLFTIGCGSTEVKTTPEGETTVETPDTTVTTTPEGDTTVETPDTTIKTTPEGTTVTPDRAAPAETPAAPKEE